MTAAGTTLRRLGPAARARIAIAALLAGCVGIVGVAVAGQAPVTPGLQFLQVGHWVYSSVFQSAYHVDGSTGQVDARVPLPDAEAGSQVAQGEQSGYVVERSRITVFSKSTLAVENTLTPPATEQPAVLEIAGGPYLVYRNAGQVVRLGNPAATVPAGGPLSEPATTGDGSVWLHRVDTGSLCELPREATRLTCAAQLESGHSGALTVVDDRPVLVDTTSDTLRAFGKDGFGESAPIGIDLPASARVASTTASGRLAVVDPERNRLHLIDTAGLRKRPAAKPVEVELPKDGRFAGPVAAERVVTLVDETRNVVLTYDSEGAHRKTEAVPGNGGTPRLSRGEDNRVYVDSPDGSHVLVVDGEDGKVVSVQIGEDKQGGSVSATASTTPTTTPTSGHPTTTTPAPPAEPEPETPSPDKRAAQAKVAVPPPVAAASAPGAPGGVTAVADDSSASVTWSPAPDNGAPVTAYHLSWPGGSVSVGGGELGATVSGLANGSSYVITVVAQNEAGPGPGASAPPIVPLGIAAAPVVTATNTFGMATVSWEMPDLRGGTFEHFLISVAGQQDRTQPSVGLQLMQFTGLVTVRAVTRFGPPGGPTVVGRPGTVVVEAMGTWPSAKITEVKRTGPETVVVTVDVDTGGSATTCAVGSGYGTGTVTVPCAGVTVITLPGVPPGSMGNIMVTVTPNNSMGNGVPASWFGIPAGSGPGGAPGKRVNYGTGMSAR